MNDPVAQVREALRMSSASAADCPSLFLRVAAGVDRRRRQRRAAAATAVVVALGGVLAVPALDLGQHGFQHAAVSAEGPPNGSTAVTIAGCPAPVGAPPNAYLRRAEALDNTACTAVGDVTTSTFVWRSARRPGLFQP
jgi:hypothetical protein